MASSTPTPKFPLTGHCSIIHEGTLYVYSPAGFQSLKLEEGAQWETLPMDVSLTGAQCVKAAPKGNAQAAKLFIVGGAVNETAAGWNYPGLMHYTFATKKWDWQRSETFATQNRQNHGAVYLQDAQKLFVYSGSQSTGDFGPSSQSFLISTVEPYSVEGLESKGAPPSVKPLLLQNDANSALLVGGGATNTAVWTYSVANGWNPMKVTLQQPITNQDAVQCAVINGDDGSKVLEKFDMSVSPNKVERILLLGKGGSDAAPGETPSQKVKRVTISDWAAYNETFAPTSTRAGYSLAQGDDGVTVASGGNQQDPIVIFDAKENSWVNSTALFKGQEILRTSESSSTISPTSTPTASSTPSATADPVAAVPPSNKGRMLTVLGATLGTIFGIAFILLLILFCIKYRKRKNKRNEGYVEKDRMSFADRGADFMKEAGGSPLPHHYNMNNASSSSLAIIGNGRVQQQGHKKNMASDASQAPLVSKASPLGYSEPVELSKFDLKPVIVEEKIVRQNSGRAPPSKSAPRARSSGWSRYFANNDATNLANVDRSTYASERTSTASQSEYTSSDLAYRNNPAQHIAPLTIPRLGDGQRLSRVASGSPTMGTPNGTLPHQVQPMQAELGRANSNGSTRSGISHDDGYFRKPVDSWTPVGDDQYQDRRTSSQYTGSMIIEPNTGKYDVTSSYYPDGAESIYAKSGYSSYYPGQTQSEIDSYPAPPRLGAAPQDRESTVTVFPGAVSQNTQSTTLPKPEFTPFFAPPRVGHESTVTVFPGPGDKKDNTNNDMSWLNLGTSR